MGLGTRTHVFLNGFHMINQMLPAILMSFHIISIKMKVTYLHNARPKS